VRAAGLGWGGGWDLLTSLSKYRWRRSVHSIFFKINEERISTADPDIVQEKRESTCWTKKPGIKKSSSAFLERENERDGNKRRGERDWIHWLGD
jgi:hypothetical protein